MRLPKNQDLIRRGMRPRRLCPGNNWTTWYRRSRSILICFSATHWWPPIRWELQKLSSKTVICVAPRFGLMPLIRATILLILNVRGATRDVQVGLVETINARCSFEYSVEVEK
jgi:hypothetical protein